MSTLAGGNKLMELSSYIEAQKRKYSRVRTFIAICQSLGIDEIG